MSPVSLDTQIEAVRSEAAFAASYAATAAIDRLNSGPARRRAEALAAAVRTLESLVVVRDKAAALLGEIERRLETADKPQHKFGTPWKEATDLLVALDEVQA